jgi:hypothetical protein
MNLLLWGALATAAAAIGLFFARFWRDSRDRLFLFFFLAFMILSLNWIGLALVPRDSESRHQVYVLRLVAFVLIIVGIIDKNRRARKMASRVQLQAAQPTRPQTTGQVAGSRYIVTPTQEVGDDALGSETGIDPWVER